MTPWLFFTTTILGIYLCFSILALWFWSKVREPLAFFHFVMATLNIIYCAIAIHAFLVPFTESRLFIIQGFLFFCGSGSVAAYFCAMTHYFHWQEKSVKRLKTTMKTIVILGSLFYFLPVFTGKLESIYFISPNPSKNIFVSGAFGSWELKPYAVIPLILGGLTSIFGHLYFLTRIIREKRREPLLVIGIIITLLSVLNDNLLVAPNMIYLVPLSFVGFVVESFRFNIILFTKYYQQTIQLTDEVIKLAKLSEAGRVSQQMSHDLKRFIGKLYDYVPENIQDGEPKNIQKAALSIINLYNQRFRETDAKPSLTSTPMNMGLEFVARIHSQELESKDIKINILCSNDIMVPLSQAELLVIFGNLINNSIDAIKSQSEKWIKISVFNKNDSLVCEFTDSGIGIDKLIRDKIFDSQFTTKTTGLGLGLNIAREILLEKGALIRYCRDRSHTTFELTFI